MGPRFLTKSISYALLDRQYESEKDDILKIHEKIFSSGQYILGEVVEELEQKIAQYCGVKHCVTLGSGTDALILGMKALGIGEGDEVITPPNSFIASTSAILQVGANPVFVDVCDDQNINVDLMEKAITKNTKAIMPVHLTGRICDMKKIKEIADRYNLLIVEDAAQSFGSEYFGQKSGSFGNIGCFSAHPLKVFNTCGDGGFVTTNNDMVVEKLKKARNHGMINRNTVQDWGGVSRMDAFKAGILLMRLERINNYIKVRRKNASFYKEKLKNEKLFIPKCKDGEFNSFQTFVVQTDYRDALQSYLLKNGVQCSVHYPTPIHLQPVAKALNYRKGDFPQVEKQSERILSLPVSQFLEQNELDHIRDTIISFWGCTR